MCLCPSNEIMMNVMRLVRAIIASYDGNDGTI